MKRKPEPYRRARTYFQAYAAAVALNCLDKAFAELQAGRTRTWTDFEVPNNTIGCGFHEAMRGVLSHHLMVRDGKIANYHPLVAHAVERLAARSPRHARAL